ncbi:MAG: hypothetical protein ACT4PL_00330 [Phycisphaerales bacterium]
MNRRTTASPNLSVQTNLQAIVASSHPLWAIEGMAAAAMATLSFVRPSFLRA